MVINMKFNLMAIVFMVIAIALGTMLGSLIAGWIGFAGGIIGIFITGFAIYVVYAYLSSQKINIMSGLIFAGLVWISGIITGIVAGATGLGGGLIGLVVQALILGLLAGKFLGGSSSPLGETKKKSTGKRRRRR